MTEERLKEIKNSLDTPVWVFTQRTFAKSYMEIHLQQELELYNEVVRLRKLFYKTIHCIKNFDYFEGEIKDDLEPMPFKYVMETDIDYLLRKLEENNLTLEQLGGIDDL